MNFISILIKILLLYLFIAISFVNAQHLFINELVSSNQRTIFDENGDYEDWIELYNGADSSISLAGYYLSDSRGNLKKWRFPDVEISGRGYLLVWASGKNRSEGELHTNFKISASGEQLTLSDSDGSILDQVAPIEIPSDVSYGRYEDGAVYFSFFSRPTPGKANEGPENKLVINEIVVPDALYEGTLDSYIEIFNNSSIPMSLHGYHLSDDVDDAKKWKFPEVVLPANSFMMVLTTTGESVLVTNGIRTNFSIPDAGGSILLSDPFGNLLDMVPYLSADHVSFGRIPDGHGQWTTMSDPSPGVPNDEVTFFQRGNYKGVAVVRITTNDGRPIDFKDERAEATMMIENGESSEYPSEYLYEGKIGIRGRGNSSWLAHEKKSFSLELWDENHNGVKYPLLNMPAEEDWALVANHADKSLMRNRISYELGRAFGRYYAPRCRHVDVWINGGYEGNYLLVERVKRSADRVDIAGAGDEDEDEDGSDVDGGYLLEVTPISRLEEGEKNFISTRYNFTFQYPRNDRVTQGHIDFIRDYILRFEAALLKSDFNDPDAEFWAYIEEDSFIDWAIINDFTKNFDGYGFYASVFIAKDKQGKLKMCPIWDFDIAYGNAYYKQPENDTSGFNLTFNHWFRRLMENKIFADKYVDRLKEVRHLIEAMPGMIDAGVEEIAQSAKTNFERWDILGKYVWPNPAPFPLTYEAEIKALKEWIRGRTSWVYGNLESLRSVQYPEPYQLRKGVYSFTAWDSTSDAGSFPAHMMFYTTEQISDQSSQYPVGIAWQESYDRVNGSRINGLNEGGVSFMNDHSNDSPARLVQSALLSLDVRGMSGIWVDFSVATRAKNDCPYALSLQYRYGSSGLFSNAKDEDGKNIIFRSESAERHFSGIFIPVDHNVNELQILWNFHPTGALDGIGAEIQLNDISISPVLCFSEPFSLHCSNYLLDSWAASSPAGLYPPHMTFFQKDVADPGLNIPFSGKWSLRYDLNNRSRINGLGDEGIAFINTGNPQDDAGFSGAAVVALNTTGMEAVMVSWTGGTVLPNNRNYAIRLQYRIAGKGLFKNVLDEHGNVVEYARNAQAGHFTRFDDILLPADALGQEYVELCWRYYHIPGNASGSRAQLRIDDIVVKGVEAIYSKFVCKGHTAELRSTVPQASGFIWSKDKVALPDNDSDMLRVETPGLYLVEAQTDICRRVEGFHVMNSTSFKPDILFINDHLVSSLNFDGASYLWYINDITVELGVSIFPFEEGAYKLRVVDAKGCSSDLSDEFYHVVQNDQNRNNDDLIDIFPNPSNGNIYIKSSANSDRAFDIQIYELSGGLIRNMSSKTNRIDISDLAEGMYILSITDGQSTTKIKVVLTAK